MGDVGGVGDGSVEVDLSPRMTKGDPCSPPQADRVNATISTNKGFSTGSISERLTLIIVDSVTIDTQILPYYTKNIVYALIGYTELV